MPSGVYKIRNIINGKIYIGQGADILLRWRQHRWNLKQNQHTNRKLQAAWSHYGEAAFEFSIVLECPEDQLGAEEIRALAEVPKDMQYNLGVAGYNPTLGMKKRRESKLQQSRSKGSRPFFVHDPKTGETERFDYVSDMTESKNLKNYINTRFKQCDRFLYKDLVFYVDPTFVPTPFVKKTEPVEKRNREVIGTSRSTGEELRFPYVSAVKKSGFTRTGVIKVLAGEMQTHKNYSWRYADGLPHKKMDAELKKKFVIGARKNGGSREVIGTDMTTGKEIRFPYVKAAAVALGITAPFIHHCLAGKMKQAAGYTWRFADQKETQ